jgi:hypothetical protein
MKPKTETKPRAGKERTPCLVCKKLFRVPPSTAKRGAGHTCSIACDREVRGFWRLIREELPGTIRDVVTRTGLKESCVRDQLGNMIRAGKCKIAGFERNPLTGVPGAPTWVPIIALGLSLDPEMPLDMRASVTHHTRTLILAAMPGAVADIAMEIGMPVTSTLRMVNTLRGEGLCHLARWVRNARLVAVATYRAGPGIDATNKLQRMSRKEINERFNKRIKGTDKHDERKARQRSAHWEKKAATTPHTWASALFIRSKEGAAC